MCSSTDVKCQQRQANGDVQCRAFAHRQSLQTLAGVCAHMRAFRPYVRVCVTCICIGASRGIFDVLHMPHEHAHTNTHTRTLSGHSETCAPSILSFVVRTRVSDVLYSNTCAYVCANAYLSRRTHTKTHTRTRRMITIFTAHHAQRVDERNNVCGRSRVFVFIVVGPGRVWCLGAGVRGVADARQPVQTDALGR